MQSFSARLQPVRSQARTEPVGYLPQFDVGWPTTSIGKIIANKSDFAGKRVYVAGRLKFSGDRINLLPDPKDPDHLDKSMVLDVKVPEGTNLDPASKEQTKFRQLNFQSKLKCFDGKFVMVIGTIGKDGLLLAEHLVEMAPSDNPIEPATFP